MHPQAGQPENHFMAGVPVRAESAMPMRTRTRPAVPSCLSQGGGSKGADPPAAPTNRAFLRLPQPRLPLFARNGADA